MVVHQAIHEPVAQGIEPSGGGGLHDAGAIRVRAEAVEPRRTEHPRVGGPVDRGAVAGVVPRHLHDVDAGAADQRDDGDGGAHGRGLSHVVGATGEHRIAIHRPLVRRRPHEHLGRQACRHLGALEEHDGAARVGIPSGGPRKAVVREDIGVIDLRKLGVVEQLSWEWLVVES